MRWKAWGGGGGGAIEGGGDRRAGQSTPPTNSLSVLATYEVQSIRRVGGLVAKFCFPFYPGCVCLFLEFSLSLAWHMFTQAGLGRAPHPRNISIHKLCSQKVTGWEKGGQPALRQQKTSASVLSPTPFTCSH